MAAIELYNTPLFNSSNLVSYWRLEGNANDSKGSNNGTSTNVTYGASYGKFGQGGSFDGSSSVITITKNSSLNLSTDWTVSYWANPYDTTNLKVVFSNGLGDYTQGGVFGYNCGNIFIKTSDGSFSVDAGMTTGWHLYTFTFSGNVLKAYKDGSFITSTNVTGTITSWGSSGDMYIGKLYTVYYYYNGYVDDIAIFNRALSASEIYNLYTGNWNIAQATLNPSKDVHILYLNPNTNYDNVGFWDVGEYKGASNDIRRGLIQFDLSSIPVGSTVVSATLRLYDTGADLATNTRTMNVRRCLRNWGETTATWNKYDGTNNWATAGGLGAGDCETSNIGSISMPGTEVAGYVEIELMPSKIQEWLNNSLTNNGMLLFMSTEVDDLHRFNSRHEASNKPELVITYIPPMGGSFLFNMI